ncbi:MAG: cytochrome c3 family protein [Rubrivivax sp.]|nr:cytochrome c3 family protein [Rubrivivax sp.]
MNRSMRAAVGGLVSALLLWAVLAFAGIADTRHNLSITGPGPVKSTTEGEVCIFCHAPHNARRDIPYLWNRADSTVTYTPYQSSTLHATVGQPTGASKLCLSCHDGTVAMGALLTRPAEVPFEGGLRFMPEGRARLGTDLSDDHPVSLVYDSALAASNGELRDPAQLGSLVKLDKNRELQCTACHDPHSNDQGNFLVASNRYSALCTTCHQLLDWPQSSHATSNKPWNGAGNSPWPNSPYATVEENGCGSCHVSHSAAGHQRLMNYAAEEDNCLVCHTGNVASRNIGRELTKLTGHKVQNYVGLHDAAENHALPGVPRHVECADCHNAHRANAGASPGAPRVSGASVGVSGVDRAGLGLAEAQNEYEICYKCHADRNVISNHQITRQIPQLNTRLEFDAGNPSFHPVTAPGVSLDVPSLLAPYTTSSVILCSDCHGNDSPTGARGPHGSNFPALLKKNYVTADNTFESPFAYALCYSCHSRDVVLSSQHPFKDHREHIVGEKTPCSACHDAHGISATQGNAINNARLINFDLNIVQPDSSGRRYYEKTGAASGRCYLNCHGKKHEPKGY